jgi:hypothetical protein
LPYKNKNKQKTVLPAKKIQILNYKYRTSPMQQQHQIVRVYDKETSYSKENNLNTSLQHTEPLTANGPQGPGKCLAMVVKT